MWHVGLSIMPFIMVGITWHGGFYYAGPGIEPLTLEGRDLKVRQKQSWVQMGALQALLAMHETVPDAHYLAISRSSGDMFKTIYSILCTEAYTQIAWRICRGGDAGCYGWLPTALRGREAYGRIARMMDARFSTACQFTESPVTRSPCQIDWTPQRTMRPAWVMSCLRARYRAEWRRALRVASASLRHQKAQAPLEVSRSTAFRFCSTKRTFEVPGQASQLNPLCG